MSTATVSMALRNYPRITPAVREWVRKAAEEMGYLSRAHALVAGEALEKLAQNAITAGIGWINAWRNRKNFARQFESGRPDPIFSQCAV